MSQRIVGSNFDTMSRETTSQPAASKALPTDFVPQKSSRSLGIFKEQDYCDCDENSHVRTGFFLRKIKSRTSQWGLHSGWTFRPMPRGGSSCHRGLPSGRAGVQGGRGGGVGARQLPGRRAKRVGVCFASNTDLELWTEEVEQGVIDNMIVFQKRFPGPPAPSLRASCSAPSR